jgi:hypothetical protein
LGTVTFFRPLIHMYIRRFLGRKKVTVPNFGTNFAIVEKNPVGDIHFFTLLNICMQGKFGQRISSYSERP